MIITNFSKGEHAATVRGLWQYSYGQVLRIQGLRLPTAVEIHFALQETEGESVTRVGVTKDGVTDVVIPDRMLENEGVTYNYNIFVFIYLTDETSGQTEYRIKMPVTSRPKPEAFNTREDAELFREAITAVNEAADRAEAAGTLGQSFAVGGTETREGEDTDNAKYYAIEAGRSRNAAEEALLAVQKAQNNAEDAEAWAKDYADQAGQFAAIAEVAAEAARRDAEQTAADRIQTEKDVAQTAADREATAADREAVETAAAQALQDIGAAKETAVGAVNDTGEEERKKISTATNALLEQINRITFSLNTEDGGLDIIIYEEVT